MKKVWKRALAMLLVVIMVGGAAHVGALTLRASAKTIGDYAKGDLVAFGWYPQSRVTNSATLTALNAAPQTWQSYGYYTGTGSSRDGQMQPSDYMQYCDVISGGQKYRGVRFSQYRPYWTGFTSSASYTSQDENGYNQFNYAYWFRYEPLQWLVLDPSTGLVMCETIIDSQPYNNYVLSSGKDVYGDGPAYWGDAAKTYYANNYAESSLRQWLNVDFYCTAFTAVQKAKIATTTLDNRAYDTSYSAYDSASTTDKIFLLSRSEVLNTSYFLSSSTPHAQGSDYAKCQGLGVFSSNYHSEYNKSAWLLRTPGVLSYHVCTVYPGVYTSQPGITGSVVSSSAVNDTSEGIRPALRLDPDDPFVDERPNELVSEVTYDQDYYWTGEGFFGEKAAITDSLELYIELTNQPPIYDYLVPNRQPKTFSPVTMSVSVNANTLTFDREGKQKTYTVTFESIDECETVNDLILLYPQSGFTSERYYTISISYSCADFDTITETYTTYVHKLVTDPIQTHINFINNNPGYRFSKENKNGHEISTLRYDAEYQWSKYTTFDFDNYYKIVVADLVTKILGAEEVELPSLLPDVVKQWKDNLKDVKDGFITIFTEDYSGMLKLDDTKLDKLIKCSKYTEDGIYTEKELYQTVQLIFGNAKNANRIKNLFATVDKTKQAIGFIKLGVNVVKETVNCVNQISLLEAFSDAEGSFKAVFQDLYNQIPDSEAKMKGAVYDYLHYDASEDGKMAESLAVICDTSWNITMDAFKSVIGKKLLDYLAAKLVSWAGTHIMVTTSAGAVVAFGKTTAFSTISSAIGGFFTGVQLGLAFSDILCDSTNKAKEMAKAISMAEYSPYIVMMLSNAEINFVRNQTAESLNRYEFAFAMHKASQIYIADHTIKAMEHKRDSIAWKLFGNRQTADDAIEMQMTRKSIFSQMACHSDEPPVVNTNSITKRKVIAVKCPVNVFVYDESGKEVIRIINDNVEFSAKDVEYAVCGSEKYILVPDTGEYDIKIVATDHGTMTYSISEWDGDEKNKEYGRNAISLTKAQTFTGSIQDGSADNAQNYNLTTNGQTIVIETISESGTKTYSVRWVVDGKTTTQSYAFGQAIQKPSNPTKDGYVFIGWSPEVPATMPDRDMTFTAQFKKNDSPQTGKVQSISAHDATLIYKSNAAIQPNVVADSGVKYKVSYSGFDSRIISVDANGKVAALKRGRTNVTVTATDEYGNTAECICKVTVKYAWWQILVRIFLLGFIWY